MRSRTSSVSSVLTESRKTDTNATEKGKGQQRVTRKNTTKTATAGVGGVGEELQQIKGAAEGRKYLEGNSLLVPAGQPLTASMAAQCLHQISIMKNNIPPTVVNALRSLAFMLDETEVSQVNELLHDGFNAEMGNFVEEMRMVMQDVRDKIKDKVEDAVTCAKMAIEEMKEKAVDGMKEGEKQVARSYAEAVAARIEAEGEKGERSPRSPPLQTTPQRPSVYDQAHTNIDPQMLAKQLIYERQYVIEG
ncbi:hypothetical protein CVT24_010241, partial [Panaeolus cyanescens]